MAVKTVGIIGTGVIGSSWTGLFLAHGMKVLVSDPAPGAEGKLSEYLKEIWPTLEKLGLAAGASLSNYSFVGASMENHYGELDFVQENAPERADLKNKIIGEIDAGTRPDVVIASSSSGIPSSQFIAQCQKNPGRVLIAHPFNPPHLMPLVEVIPHPGADPKAIQDALDFYKSVGKQPVHIRKELPGFVANRLQMALCAEAYSLVNRGIVTAEDLDTCMTTSLGPRWAIAGPMISNALGGGGGGAGFRHIVEHVGSAAMVWLADMNANAFSWSKEDIGKVADSVDEECSNVGDISEDRDTAMVELLKLKAAAASKSGLTV